MPTYQYACTACDHAFEQVQGFSEPSLTECPECANRVRKVYNAVGVVFKGSGFYRNDSRSGSRSEAKAEASSSSDKAAKSDSSAGSDSSSGSSSSGDTNSTAKGSPKETSSSGSTSRSVSTPA